MNTPDAVKLISIAAREFNGKAQIGAGTVTSLNEAKEAISRGTVYRSPVVNPKSSSIAKSTTSLHFRSAHSNRNTECMGSRSNNGKGISG